MIHTIEQSFDYDSFKFLSENRKIDKTKVERFQDESKKHPHLMEMCPILVNEKREIFDGQHRFLACKENGLPITFIQSSDLKKEDIIIFNKDQKNWNFEDYFHFYIASGNVNFEKIMEFANKNSLSTTISCLFLGFNRKKLVYEVKNGKLRYPSQEVVDFAQRLSDLHWEFRKIISQRREMFIKYRNILSFSFLEFTSKLPKDTNLDSFKENVLGNLDRFCEGRTILEYMQIFRSLGHASKPSPWINPGAFS